MMLTGTPSRASSSSSACAWAQLMRREAAPDAGRGREAPELDPNGGARPRSHAGSAVDHAEQRSDRELRPRPEPWPQLLPAPLVHADLATTPALAVTHQQRPTPLVEVVLGERERLLDAQPGTPQHQDHRSQARAVTKTARRATALRRWFTGRPERCLVGPERSFSGPNPRESPGTRMTGRRRSGRPVAVFSCKPSGCAARGGPPHTREVAGSNPAAPTRKAPGNRQLSGG
jgi:hypothetical protein